MIRGPLARSATAIRILGKTFAPVVAVPLLNAAESRPDSVDGVLGVRTKISEFSRQHRSAPCSIDDPTRASGAFATIDRSADPLSIPIIQLEVCYFRRTP